MLYVRHPNFDALEEGVRPAAPCRRGEVFPRPPVVCGRLERGVETGQHEQTEAYLPSDAAELVGVAGKEVDLVDDSHMPHAKQRLATLRKDLLSLQRRAVQCAVPLPQVLGANALRVLHSCLEDSEEGLGVLRGYASRLEQRGCHPRHLDELGHRLDGRGKARCGLDDLVARCAVSGLPHGCSLCLCGRLRGGPCECARLCLGTLPAKRRERV
mmetsp:Transcript_65774/g.109287  ORF Transcript_65774/g.109287 Transcript_65774/m.109287 type:complete len:213 (+) Transcript_65774:701-1339(+)